MIGSRNRRCYLTSSNLSACSAGDIDFRLLLRRSSLIDAPAARFSSNVADIPFGRSETQMIGARFQGCANSGRFKFKKSKDNQGSSNDERELSQAIGCAKVQEIARLYAHLTARQFKEAGDASFMGDLSRSSVVVTTFEYLDANLLQALYSNAGALSCPGLICASGVEELRRQVLVRSILARPGLIEEVSPWTAIFPTVKTGTPAGHRLQVLDFSLFA